MASVGKKMPALPAIPTETREVTFILEFVNSKKTKVPLNQLEAQRDI